VRGGRRHDGCERGIRTFERSTRFQARRAVAAGADGLIVEKPRTLENNRAYDVA
jgi:3-deoxy-D-arabino-heptulosonate 7-phosphate (DAHP) synthase